MYVCIQLNEWERERGENVFFCYLFSIRIQGKFFSISSFFSRKEWINADVNKKEEEEENQSK